MTLGKATVENLKAIEDDDESVGAVGNLTKPRLLAMLVMYEKTVGFQTAKDILRLYYIVALNSLRDLNNSAVILGSGAFDSKIQEAMILKFII